MPPGSSSRRLYQRSSSTLGRSQHFKAARLNIAIGDNANLSTVYGDQYNNYNVQEQKKAKQFVVGTQEEEDEYEQFCQVLRGDVLAFRNVHCGPGRWYDKKQADWIESGEQMVVAGQVRIGKAASECMAVSYSGHGAEESWKRDFQRLGGVRNAENAQLIAINLSSIPMLILTGELVPVAHVQKQAGVMGRLYLRALVQQTGCFFDGSLWMDTSRSVFCRGPRGPRCISGFDLNLLQDFPLDAELLRKDIMIRFLSSTSRGDTAFNWLSVPPYNEPSATIVGRPTVISTLTNTTLAVGNGDWKEGKDEDEDSCLGEREVMPNGVTRFTLKHNRRRLELWFNRPQLQRAWPAQALSVFHAHGIPLEGDLSTYKLVIPEKMKSTLSKSRTRQRRRQNCPTIYLFLSISVFWSFDPNGQTSISNHLCRYLGLPPRLSPKCYEYAWPTEVYEFLQPHQIVRGFDPITTDYARHLEHPIYEIWEQCLPSRFEDIDDSELPNGSPYSPAQLRSGKEVTHQQELEDFSLGLLFGNIQLEAPGNVASTAHASRIDCALRRGAPRASYRKGAESVDFSKKPLAAASLRQAARQTISSLKSTFKPILSRPARSSTLPAKPHFSTTTTKPTELTTRKASRSQSSLLTGSDKNRIKETPRPREVIAATKNTAVDTRRRNPIASVASGILANGTRNKTDMDMNTRRPRSTVYRGSPVVPTRKTSASSATTAKTKIFSPLTLTTTAAAGTMKQSGSATARRVSSDVRMRTGTDSNVTRPHRGNQTATSASAAPRLTIPKSSSSNAVAATASSTRPPSTCLASVGSTKAGGRGAATTMGSSSSQATASRSRLGRTSPAQEGVPERRSSNTEERTRMLARTSNDSPNAPSPFVTTTPRRIATRPPLRWR